MKETNMEHFRDEIEAVEHRPALIDGKIKSCVGSCCKDCSFYTSTFENCSGARISWLMSEYKPEPVLTQREKHFVEFVETGWLARDKDDELWWYSAKPKRGAKNWVDGQYSLGFRRVLDFSQHFRFITWEDEEPWAVEDLRKLKVEDA